jgi:hypothetical protein
VVIERYFEGQDRAVGIGDLGTVKFTPDTMHDLRSCSKSIVGLLYGIGRDWPAPRQSTGAETPLFSAFPEYADLAENEGRSRLTVHHVLSMTMGTDWD